MGTQTGLPGGCCFYPRHPFLIDAEILVKPTGNRHRDLPQPEPTDG